MYLRIALVLFFSAAATFVCAADNSARASTTDKIECEQSEPFSELSGPYIVSANLDLTKGDLRDIAPVDKSSSVLALPGGLDAVEMFNSNSPEIVRSDGILLSTFPGSGKSHPAAHLNHLLAGRVDFFVHHINNQIASSEPRTLHLALLLQNAGDSKARVKILAGASYLSQPDAPFVSLPALVSNDNGSVFAGPGDRVMDDILRGRRDEQLFDSTVELEPHSYALLLDAAVPVSALNPSLNGRSTLIQVETNQPLYAAALAKLLPPQASPPPLSQWIELLQAGNWPVLVKKRRPFPVLAKRLLMAGWQESRTVRPGQQ